MSKVPGDIVIGDFELAARLWDEDDYLQGVAGTVGYSAPEAITGARHGKPADIWR
jgi:serine/threonine protein kinase